MNILITTPIYYINDKPHIGHTYSMVIANTLKRLYKKKGYNVLLSTGTDENSQKTVEAAKKFYGKENVTINEIKEYTNYMANIWKETWIKLKIEFDDFIRTTEERHIKTVYDFFKKAYKNGYIYKDKYKGLYCRKCEAFYKEEDLIEGNCPIHKTPVEYLEEENYFFKLKNFKEKLEEYINKLEVLPISRKNELLGFIKEGLMDFSISRENKIRGIKFPIDNNHVFYVWYDALVNYLTVLDYPNKKFEDYWINGKIIHVIGKDILKFHGIYWPAMLFASGYPGPSTLLVHGFFTINGEKISKSLNNAINPLELNVDIDGIVYYLLSQLKIGQDGDFSINLLKDIYNSHLVNGRGNLVNRITKLAYKYQIKEKSKPNIIKKFIDEIKIETNDLWEYVNMRYNLVKLGNEIVDKTKPWEHPDKENLIKELIYFIIELNELSYPFLINGYEKFFEIVPNNLEIKPDILYKKI